MRFDGRALLLVGAALAFGFGVLLAVAMFVAGHAVGAGLAWAVAQRGANWLGGHASAGLRRARTTAGLLLVMLSGWMTANAIITG